MRILRPVLAILWLATASAWAQTESDEPAPTSRAEILRRQREEKQERLEPYRVSDTEGRMRAWEKAKFPQKWLVKGWRGFRPVIGGMPPGSGFVLGGGYIHGLEAQYYQFQANARVSTRGYTTADAEFVFPPPQTGRRIELKLRGEYRDFTSLRFFGLGNGSSVDDRTTYLQNDQTGMAYFWLNPRGLVSLGAYGGYMGVRTDSGETDRSIEDVFVPDQVPGFMMGRTEYGISGGWLELDLRDKWAVPEVGVVARVTAERYENRGEVYDFTRIIGDFKGYIPLGHRSRIVALRLRTSHSQDDEESTVPFYLMEVLGGAKTVRGFDEWRFRDERNLYVSAEYRWEVSPNVDFTAFLDAGKVFDKLEDFNFEDMKTGYGFGLRTHAFGNVLLRMDMAFGREGPKFHVSGGPSF